MIITEHQEVMLGGEGLASTSMSGSNFVHDCPIMHLIVSWYGDIFSLPIEQG
jgi:hypothetical protein